MTNDNLGSNNDGLFDAVHKADLNVPLMGWFQKKKKHVEKL